MMGMVVPAMKIHQDTWGLKKLFSVGLRRWGVPLGRRQETGAGNLNYGFELSCCPIIKKSIDTIL